VRIGVTNDNNSDNWQYTLDFDENRRLRPHLAKLTAVYKRAWNGRRLTRCPRIPTKALYFHFQGVGERSTRIWKPQWNYSVVLSTLDFCICYHGDDEEQARFYTGLKCF